MESYIRLSRKIRDHWIWENETALKKWIDLLMLANYADGKFLHNGKLINVKVGEYYTPEEKLAKRWGTILSTMSWKRGLCLEEL